MIQKQILFPSPMEAVGHWIESQQLAEVCRFHGEWLLRFPDNQRTMFNDDQLLSFAKRHGYDTSEVAN